MSWSGVGRVMTSNGSAPGRRGATVLRVTVARSLSNVRKLCTEPPSAVRLLRALACAASDSESADRADLREAIERQIDEGETGGFNIDAVLDEDWTMPERPAPAMTMDDLDRVIGGDGLMPQGTQVRALGPREYALRAPGMSDELRVTTNPEFYEEHTESAEFWSPGSPLFIPPENVEVWNEVTPEKGLRALLDDR